MAYPPCKVNPRFLHSNSTSHTWAFSAVAELIDNAYDPDVRASRLLIDKVDINDTPCLVFLDNGDGMDHDKLHKMLSFGFSDKEKCAINGAYKPIGQYGNGFKSGSMRLGKDALVFTRCQESASVGFLSQTFLEQSGVDSVVVPMVEYTLPDLTRSDSLNTEKCLRAILDYSIYREENALLEELRSFQNGSSGTKIIIYNLKLQDGSLELDFASDLKDIRCPEVHRQDTDRWEDRTIATQISEYKTSLREYCKILYLHPRMRIILRGTLVKTELIDKSLYKTEIDTYRPNWLDKPVKIIIGISCDKEKTEDYGMMLYNKKRLIKAYEKVGYQKQPNEKGVGVVGVAEVDFLTPTQNKQDFIPDDKFRSLMLAFGNKLNDYWNTKMEDSTQASMTEKNPDCLWVQCDGCNRWRRQPRGTLKKHIPKKWFCRMNRDATHNRCDIPEEREDKNETLVRSSYKKNKRSQKKNIEKKGNTPETARSDFNKHQVPQSRRRLSCDNPTPMPARRKISDTDDDSDETTNSSRRKSLRSSSSKTETTTVYKARQKMYPFDKHGDDANDEPDTTSVAETPSESNRSNTESSLENIPCEAGGDTNQQEQITSSCHKYLSEKDADNNNDNYMCSDDNDEANTMSMSVMSLRLDESNMPSSSFVPTESLHRDTYQPGSEIRQNRFEANTRLAETEKEMKILKTDLAEQKNINKQLEDRLDKISCNVRKLLSLPALAKYYDSPLDNVEENIEDIIRKIDASNEEMTMQSDNVLQEMEDMITDIAGFEDAIKHRLTDDDVPSG